MGSSNNGIRNRWVALAASVWIQALIGGHYTFSIYSPILKSSQAYDQTTLDTVSVFKDIGSSAGVLSGLLYYSLATTGSSYRHGMPWPVHFLGAGEGLLGYLFIWLAVVKAIPQPPVPIMCVAMFFGAHAKTYFSTWNVVTAVQNFPAYSGTAVGLMKGFLGLSGAILLEVYEAFFKDNPSMYILMLALLPTIVSLSLVYFVKDCPEKGPDDKKYLNALSLIAILSAAYLMIILITEDFFVFPHWARLFSFLILVFFLSSPLKIATIASKNEIPNPLLVTYTDPLLHNKIGADELNEKRLADDDDRSLEFYGEQESMNLWQAMRTLNFWLLVLAMLCGMGAGLATINNMSQLGQSLGYSTSKINTLVSLWSIWNFFGRFGAGYMSDYLLRQRGWPRPSVIAIALAVMSIGHLIIGAGFDGNLYIGTIIVGICYGALWSLMATITSELFGVLHMGTLYNAISIGSPFGTYILSVWVIGHIYDQEAGEHNFCAGIRCFRVSFFVIACVSFFGFLVALTLFYRTRDFYRLVVLKRLRYVLSRK